MRLRILLSFMALAQFSHAQWYVGAEGGVNLNDIYFANSAIKTELFVTYSGGIRTSYIPEGKKPGFHLSLQKVSTGFVDLASGRNEYINQGYEFQFLSHLYTRINNTGLFINAGPGLSWLNNPTSTLEFTNSLPDFTSSNLSEVYIHLVGGGGISQLIGKVKLSVFGLFSYSTTKVYNRMDRFSNPYFTRIGFSIQTQIRRKEKPTGINLSGGIF